MLNIEELTRLAEAARFDITVIEPEPAGPVNHNPSDIYSPRCASYSICVCAPPRDERARYEPFNSKIDRAAKQTEHNIKWLSEAAQALAIDGLMFIYGLPRELARYTTALSDALIFRYWVVIRTMTSKKSRGLQPEHTGLLVLSKPGARINRIRIPHPECRSCGQTLKDWGGKSHLMHPRGVALSDVWMDMVVDPESRMPGEVFERILQLSEAPGRDRLALIAPDGQPAVQDKLFDCNPTVVAFDPLKWKKARRADKPARSIPGELIDKLHKAPCLGVLKKIPSGTIDLAFADPPFNLTKKYNGYDDDRADEDYLGWSKRWLLEYERVLKPGGAMFILNIPKWAAHLADFLSRRNNLFLQSWIAWNALPEPKGMLMPAHYALLYFTKGADAERFNYCSMENGWQPFDEAVFPPDRPDVCRRPSCIRKRRASASTWRGELTDIWHDIHRVRQPMKNAVVKKLHPCETPERLIDRIIRLATNAGDVVLDAFAGTGTSAMVAKRLGRRFIAIEQNDTYIRFAESKVSEPRSLRGSSRKLKRSTISKRALQLELKQLASELGRLPTRADLELLSRYELECFDKAFRSWSEALKAARAAMEENPNYLTQYVLSEQDKLESFELREKPEIARPDLGD